MYYRLGESEWDPKLSVFAAMWHSNYLMPSGYAASELSDQCDCLQKSSLSPLCCFMAIYMLRRREALGGTDIATLKNNCFIFN